MSGHPGGAGSALATGPAAGSLRAEGRRSTGRTSRVPTWLTWYAVAWFLLLSALACLRAWAFFADAFDLGFFTQGLGRIVSKGPLSPTSITGWGLLQDHFSPLALPLAPIMAAGAGPYGLIVAQAAAVASAIPLGWRAAVAAGADRERAALLAVGLSVAPVVLFAVWFDFHPSLLALPLLLVMIEGIETEDHRRIILGGLGAALAREDVALLVLVIGIVATRRSRRGGAVVAAAAVLVLVLGKVVTGGDGGGWFFSAGFGYVDLSRPGATAALALSLLWFRGALLVNVLSWSLPWIAWGRVRWLPLAIGGFYSLPFLLAAVPTTKVPGFHYYAVIAPLALWAVAGVSVRTVPRRTLIIGVLLVSLAAGPLITRGLSPFAYSAAEVVSTAWSARDELRAAHAAADCVPEAVPQSWISPLVPFVASRPSVYMWPHPFLDIALFGQLKPIVEADPGIDVAVVVTAAPHWDRYALFPDATGLLLDRRFEAISAGLIDIWVRDPALGAEIASCLGARGAPSDP